MSQTDTSVPTKKRKGILHSFFFNAFIIAVLCAAMYFVFFSSLGWITHHKDDVKVPKLVNMKAGNAMKIIQAMGFEVVVDSFYDPNLEPLLVTKQQPDPSDIVKKGRTLFITINKAVPPSIPMPELVNLSLRSALMAINNNRLIMGDTTFRPDIADGAVLEQNINGVPIKAGQYIPQGSRINLVVGTGLGNSEINVPDLFGKTLGEATLILQGLGLISVNIPEDAITDSLKGIVIDQVPQPLNDIGIPIRIHTGDFIDLHFKQNPYLGEADSVRKRMYEAIKNNQPKPDPIQGSEQLGNNNSNAVAPTAPIIRHKAIATDNNNLTPKTNPAEVTPKKN